MLVAWTSHRDGAGPLSLDLPWSEQLHTGEIPGSAVGARAMRSFAHLPQIWRRSAALKQPLMGGSPMRTNKMLATVLIYAAAAMSPAGCGIPTRDAAGPKDDKAVVAGPPDVAPPPGPVAGPTAPAVAARASAGKAKPLSDTVRKGLTWMAAHQLKSGGWGQGDEAAGMSGQAAMRDTANVADTSMALLAFVRAGNTPSRGDHQDVVRRGVEFVLSEVEAADTDSLYVTKVRGTRVQGKIGPYVDTFAALMILTEAKGTMRDGVGNARVERALRKVVTKLEKNQKANGTWDDRGWAPVLSQAMAAKGVNRAAQSGIDVSEGVIDRIEAQAVPAAAPPVGTAGVELYGEAAKSSAARESATTRRDKAARMKEAKRRAEAAEAPPAPTAAEIATADKKAKASEDNAGAVEAKMIERTSDPSFVAGFGNNGGEEFLSYMLISESLVARGGDEWARWDRSITQLVNGVQNEDGSWTGHHCITGRTFCTAAALLVLLADRAPAGQVASIAK
jgi:hypothetical protein